MEQVVKVETHVPIQPRTGTPMTPDTTSGLEVHHG
jgi:hypothetical protein